MAKRESPMEIAPPADRESLRPSSFRTVNIFDPSLNEALHNDPIAQAISGSYRKTDRHGRIAYDQMRRHAAAGNPFDTLMSILASIQVSYVAPQQEPTDIQREMADFLNSQLARLDWPQFVDGVFGQGFQYGFSLTELSTVVESWKKRPFVQIREVSPLPQASLDDSHPLSSLSSTSIAESSFRPTYTCFKFGERNRVVGYHQYYSAARSGGEPGGVSWTSPEDRLRILHFKHGGGDGNPFGCSLFFTAFDHWADLYLIEKMEQLILENAAPYLTATYTGDETKPDLHDAIEVKVSEQDPTQRLLVGNNLTFGKVTTSDPDYVAHVERKKRELRDYISLSLLIPPSVYRETGQKDLDTRNLTQVFLKFVVPSYMNEIANFMTKQFGKRLIDSNYSNLEASDYPVMRWRFITPNDLRLVTSLLQTILPHLDSEKLGEVFSEYLPGFEPEYVARDPKKSVGVVRQSAITEATAEVKGDGTPPPKEQGEDRERIDGETENPSGTMETSA